MLARVAGRGDLAVEGALAEAARHEDARRTTQHLLGVAVGKRLAVDELDLHVLAQVRARVVQRLDDGEIRVGQLGVLAHERDLHGVALVFRMVLRGEELLPIRHVALARVEPQALADAQVEVLLGHHARHVVDGRGVLASEHAIHVHVGERGDLGAHVVVDVVVAAQHDDVGLDAEAPQLLDGVLRGLGLHLMGRRDIGHERDVDVADVLGAGILLVLADGLDERLTLDVADRAAELGDDHVGVRLLLDAAELGLDGVRHMRDDLHRAAEEVAVALARDEVLVDGARGEVGVAREVLVDEALVMTEVEIAFVAVLGDEHLAVLERAHGARVHVEIRVGLLHGHPVAARLEQTPQRRRGDALAQRADHAAGHEYMLCHGVYLRFPSKSAPESGASTGFQCTTCLP